ncbi:MULTISPECIES: hypothetical protein [Streptomyces]|uniref:Uncharacterized protein n=1 Tax=Streptomyces fungicidicus TaxID=68203 RepID=A0ACC7XWD8_9ACTN|nr:MULTISPECIES: hypothetical protein [Streptomyces]MBF4135605.1 hypothetical protein [Streptomyces albidoflavus]NUV73877.1 hypothetical protein [Streptomyces fungicidicus]PAX84691.1 hypothetical protein CLM81_15700 [Streptomyces albidoflavus]PAX86827.1 hypothetical protein CLM82_28225 [Streptomyces albidoflavus]PBO16106.1 hypothetical protein CLM83_25855 [Streptomyces albidoflavus]
MAIAELVLKYLDTLVWPVVTVVLVWMLRAQIRQAFGRLTRLETPAGTLEFEAEARAVREEADDLRAPEEEPSRTLPGSVRTDPDGGWPQDEDQEPPPDVGALPPDPEHWPYEIPRGGAWGAPSGGGDGPYRSGPLPPPQRDPFQDALDLAADSPVRAVALAWERLVACALDVLETRGRPLGPQPYAHSTEQIRGWLAGLGLPVEAQGVHIGLQALWNQAFQHPEAVTPAAARDYVRSCRALAREIRELR